MPGDHGPAAVATGVDNPAMAPTGVRSPDPVEATDAGDAAIAEALSYKQGEVASNLARQKAAA